MGATPVTGCGGQGPSGTHRIGVSLGRELCRAHGRGTMLPLSRFQRFSSATFTGMIGVEARARAIQLNQGHRARPCHHCHAMQHQVGVMRKYRARFFSVRAVRLVILRKLAQATPRSVVRFHWFGSVAAATTESVGLASKIARGSLKHDWKAIMTT